MEVIYLNYAPNTSFSYANGLYAIAKLDNDNNYHLAKIMNDGKIDHFESGNVNITITGMNNPAIVRTKLICNEHINY